MPATFLLAADDAPDGRAGRALLAAALARAPGPAPTRACALGAAHGDDPRRLRAVVRGLRDALGGAAGAAAAAAVTVAAPRLSDPGLDVAAAAAAIAAAEVLFLDGGDTLALVEAVRARGLAPALAAAARAARVVYGLSAGACAASPFTVGYDDDGAARVAPCLDLGVPWPADVHDEDDAWPEMRALLALCPGGTRGLVIPTGAAALVVDGAGLALAGAPELRALGPDGAWRVEALPPAAARG